jgi:F-type H+-transporting ATPase subunit b
VRGARKHASVVLCVLPLFFCFALEEGAKSAGSANFLGKCINFVILFGGLAFLLNKPVRRFLSLKSEEKKRSLKEAEEGKLSAEEKRRTTEQRLGGLQAEAEGILEEAKSAGLKEKSKIGILAGQEVERIKRFTQQEIEAQVKSGVHELKEYAAELAARLAEERLKKDLTEEEHSRLIDRSIDRLQELYERSYSR